MASIIAPPEIFSAYAFAVEPGDNDPDLRRGTHLRIYAGLGASFPLAPFLAYGIVVDQVQESVIDVTDLNGLAVNAPPDLGAHGVLDATLLLQDTDEFKTVQVELDDSAAVIERVALLDQHGRTIAVRNKGPWTFSAPVLHKLRVWGSNGQIRVRKRMIAVNLTLELSGRHPLSVLGLPIEGRHRWYVGTQNRDHAVQRVGRGAPLRLNPMDRPFGPFDVVSDQDEVARIKALQDAMAQDVAIDTLLKQIADDPAAPWLQYDSKDLPPSLGGASQFANMYRLAKLQIAATEPGMARYLGFADLIAQLPNSSGERWNSIALIGLFALSPRDFVRFGVDVTSLQEGPAPRGDVLYTQFIRGLENATGSGQRDAIEEIVRLARINGFAVAPFVTFVSPVQPWLPPSVPKPQIIQTRWQESRNGLPSSVFRSSFAFPNMPLASLSALARQERGQWVTRHDLLNVATTNRAAPGIFGHEVEAYSRLFALGLKSMPLEAAGLLADHDIPADIGAVGFAARASDFFGRFGPEALFDVNPPERPKPPKPILRFHFERNETIDLKSDAELSPGVLKVSVAVPRPWPESDHRFSEADKKKLGSAIIVPRIDDLPRGALPISTIQIGIGSLSESIDVQNEGIWASTLTVPPLGPRLTGIYDFVASYIDAAGNVSELAKETFKVTDIRPPKVYKTGMGLFWSSAPGPSLDVEVKLRWPADDGTRHRVYLTDQAGLGLADSDFPQQVEPSRGLVAAVGCKKVMDGLPGDKRVYRLLTDPSLIARGGLVTFSTLLPRSLETVQFLRVVPLGPDGAEPNFHECGIVPVAVPESRRPSSPQLDGKVDPATGFATLTVSSDGIDLIALERDEPGLFHPGMPGTEAPQTFIRRAVGPVADPIYAPVLPRPVAMRFSEADGLFTAEIIDTNQDRGLVPFVRYIYWAELRLPPERRLPADFIEIDGDIAPVDPSAAQNHPRPKSLPSAPRTLMYAPPEPQAAPEPANVEITRAPGMAPKTVVLTIKVSNPPVAHKKAIDQYRLAVWVQWPQGAITPLGDGSANNNRWPEMPGGAVTAIAKVPEDGDPLAPLMVRLAFVDPVNRLSEITSFNVS